MMRDLLATTLFATLLLSPAAHGLEAKVPDGWTEATRNNEVIVFFKENEKAQARNLLAYTEFDASPEAVFKVATDFENYPKFMPYSKDAKIFKKNSPADLIVYHVMDVPLQPSRDYFLHMHLTKGTSKNGGVFRSEWASEPETEPVKEGLIRIKINEGAWSFEPLDGGKRTRVTYSLLTHPGGDIPKWALDQNSVAAIPNVFKALRERLKNQPQPKAVSAAH